MSYIQANKVTFFNHSLLATSLAISLALSPTIRAEEVNVKVIPLTQTDIIHKGLLEKSEKEMVQRGRELEKFSLVVTGEHQKIATCGDDIECAITVINDSSLARIQYGEYMLDHANNFQEIAVGFNELISASEQRANVLLDDYERKSLQFIEKYDETLDLLKSLGLSSKEQAVIELSPDKKAELRDTATYLDLTHHIFINMKKQMDFATNQKDKYKLKQEDIYKYAFDSQSFGHKVKANGVKQESDIDVLVAKAHANQMEVGLRKVVDSISKHNTFSDTPYLSQVTSEHLKTTDIKRYESSGSSGLGIFFDKKFSEAIEDIRNATNH